MWAPLPYSAYQILVLSVATRPLFVETGRVGVDGIICHSFNFVGGFACVISDINNEKLEQMNFFILYPKRDCYTFYQFTYGVADSKISSI